LCGETFITLPLTFNTRIFGIPNNQITINDNGVVYMGNQGNWLYNGGSQFCTSDFSSIWSMPTGYLTTVSVFGDYMFPAADCDPNINPEGWSVYWEIRSNGTNYNQLSSPRILIIQYDNVPDWWSYIDTYINGARDPAQLDKYTFQFIFYENSDNFLINVKQFITRYNDGYTTVAMPAIGAHTPNNPLFGYADDWVYWAPGEDLPELWYYDCGSADDMDVQRASIFFYISPPSSATPANTPEGDACVNPIISVYTEEGLVEMNPYDVPQPRTVNLVDGLFSDNDDDGGDGIMNNQFQPYGSTKVVRGTYDHMDAWFRYDTQEEDTIIIFDAVPNSKALCLIAQLYEWESDEDPPAVVDLNTNAYDCTALRPVRAVFWPSYMTPGGMIRMEFPLPLPAQRRLMPRKAYYVSVQAVHPALADQNMFNIQDSTKLNFDPTFYWAFQHGYTPINTCVVPPENQSCDRAFEIGAQDEYYHDWGCTAYTGVAGRPEGTNYYWETNTPWCLNPTSGKGLPMIGHDVVYKTVLSEGDYICVGQFAYFDSGIYMVGPDPKTPNNSACMDIYNNCQGGSDVAFGSLMWPEIEYVRFSVVQNPTGYHEVAPGTYYFIIDSYSPTEFGDYEFFFYRLTTGCTNKKDITGDIHVDNDFVCEGQSQLVLANWDCGPWGANLGVGGGASQIQWLVDEQVISTEKEFYWTFMDTTTFELRVWCPGCIGYKTFEHTTPVEQAHDPFDYGLTASLIPKQISTNCFEAQQIRVEASCDLADNPLTDLDYSWYVNTLDQNVPQWHGASVVTFVACQPPLIPDENGQIKLIVKVSCTPERGMCNATVTDTAIIQTKKAKPPVSTDLLAGEIRVAKPKFAAGFEALNLNFRLEQARSLATVKIYDLRHRLVRTMLLDAVDEDGTFLASWDGKDDSGNLLSSGTYIWEIGADNNAKKTGVTVLTR